MIKIKDGEVRPEGCICNNHLLIYRQIDYMKKHPLIIVGGCSMYIIGLDVHKNSSYYSMIDDAGREVKKGEISNDT